MCDDPCIHTFETDRLPDDHPWSRVTVSCGGCGVMVHAFNNECMQVWVEWADCVLCWPCFQSVCADGPAFGVFAGKAQNLPSIER